jgi:hypothetical protein
VKHLHERDPETAEVALLLARCRAAQRVRAEADSLYADAVERFARTPYRPRELEAARQEWRASTLGGRR